MVGQRICLITLTKKYLSVLNVTGGVRVVIGIGTIMSQYVANVLQRKTRMIKDVGLDVGDVFGIVRNGDFPPKWYTVELLISEGVVCMPNDEENSLSSFIFYEEVQIMRKFNLLVDAE
jgi:hypothetical protein